MIPKITAMTKPMAKTARKIIGIRQTVKKKTGKNCGRIYWRSAVRALTEI